MKGYHEVFFESFNLAMRRAYDAFMEIEGKRASNGYAQGDDKLEACLDNEYEKWSSERLTGLEKTPCEYLEDISFDEMTEMFICGAALCDDELPAIYVEKLLTYGDNAVDFLIKSVACKADQIGEESLSVSVMSAKVLGLFKAEKAVIPLIDSLESSAGVSELMQETVRDALVQIGHAATNDILRELSSGSRSGETCEYLLMSLAEIGRDRRSDAIYSALKNAFNEFDDKALAAACLAKYGDGRAVPALRGYLLKSGGMISKESFYDIVSAVRQLGGRIDDLKHSGGSMLM